MYCTVLTRLYTHTHTHTHTHSTIIACVVVFYYNTSSQTSPDQVRSKYSHKVQMRSKLIGMFDWNFPMSGQNP